MPTPRISVLLPTRNRPAQATLSIRSALRQDVTAPFEVVVAENYDDDTPAQALRREFTGDGRVRVIRTGGLALDENWEAALAAADGEYLMLISDKCLLRRSALSRMLDACEAHDCLAATAPMAVYGETGLSGWVERLHSAAERVEVVRSTEAAAGFVREPYAMFHGGAWLPIACSTMVHCTVADQARKGPLGALFAPILPDFTSAFQVLALTDRFVAMGAPLVLYAFQAAGNTASLVRQDAEAHRFESRLRAENVRPYESFPFAYRTAANRTLRDYERVSRLLHGRLPVLELWLPGYFEAIAADGLTLRELGADHAEHFRRMLDALAALSPADRQGVESRLQDRYHRRVEELASLVPVRSRVPFASAWDLMEWQEQGGAYLSALGERVARFRDARQEKEQVMRQLAQACDEKAREIDSLTGVAQERLALVERLTAERSTRQAHDSGAVGAPGRPADTKDTVDEAAAPAVKTVHGWFAR